MNRPGHPPPGGGSDPAPRWEIDAVPTGVIAGCTMRGPDGSDDYGLASPGSVETWMGRWRGLPRELGGPFAGVVTSRQPHGARIRVQRGRLDGWLIVDGYDGHVTAEPGVLLTVTVADCVPVFLTTVAGATVGLLHAGWRGVAAGVLEAGVEAVREVASCGADAVGVHCGPAISGARYEVGSEVLEALGVPGGGEPHHLDLRAVVADRARRLGVRRVTVSRRCTYDEPTRFHSYRRDGAEAGRMVAYLGRPLT